MAKIPYFDKFRSEEEIREIVRSSNEKSENHGSVCYESMYSSDVYEQTPKLLGIKKGLSTICMEYLPW